MIRKIALLLCLSCCCALQFCAASKNTASRKESKTPPAVSYVGDVAPILKERCTPCHFPDGGKKKFLDTYGAVSENIDDILRRVQLPRDSSSFMPWKGKKPPLSDSLVAVLKVWKDRGMAD